jgi:hypothetical protein
MTRRILILLTLAASTGCGLKYGDGTPNDPPPTGTILLQGQIFPQAATVSGTAVVYAASGGGFIFRLSGLSAPSESGMQVRAVTQTGTTVTISGLRAYSGNQNYYLSYPAVTWAQLLIWSTATDQAYGLAILQ